MATKTDERRKRQEAAGIPDSKNFGDPEAGPTRVETCHIQGVLVSDLNLAPHVIAALDYWATDEGIQERNSQPNRVEPSGIALGPDEWNKALQHKRDDVLQRDIPISFSHDPLKECMDRHKKPGMRAKFLSAAKVKENGGTGDYTVVKDAAGDPVKVRGMVLGHVPEEVAQARNRHYQDKSRSMIKALSKQYKQEGGATAVVDQ